MDTVHEEALAAAGTRPGGTIDLNAAMRSLLEGLLNALMDEQAFETGAQRNGYRERSLDTCVGRVALRIPKLRRGTYFPDDVVERWSRTDTALASAICEMWVGGVSTRKAEAAAELGVERMSHSRVSRLCASLDAKVDEMRGGDLSYSEWPYLWLDASYVPCREAGAARSTALAVAVACDSRAHRRSRCRGPQGRLRREGAGAGEGGLPQGLRAAARARRGGRLPARGGRGHGAGLPRLPREAQGVGQDEQRPGEDEPRDQAPRVGGTGVPVGRLAAAAGGRGVLRPERRLGGRAQLHRPQDPGGPTGGASSAAPAPEDLASVITLVEEALDRKLRTA